MLGAGAQGGMAGVRHGQDGLRESRKRGVVGWERNVLGDVGVGKKGDLLPLSVHLQLFMLH